MNIQKYKTGKLAKILNCTESYASLIKNDKRKIQAHHIESIEKYELNNFNKNNIIPRLEEKIDILTLRLEEILKNNEERAKLLRGEK
jgi:hypothetical protein